MKSVFTQTLLAFFVAFIIFMVILSSIFLIGLNRSVSGWDHGSRLDLEQKFRKKIDELVYSEADLVKLEDHEFIRDNVPSNIPFFIFDKNKKLLIACRNGYEAGFVSHNSSWIDRYLTKHAREIQYNEIRKENILLGHFYLGKIGFADNSANRKLLESISGTLWFGLGGAFILSFLFAFFFSRNFSGTAKIIAEGIDGIAHGKFDLHIPEKGSREMIQIAGSANLLGAELKREAELRSQWSQDITHDLRTPITALRAQLEGMKDGVLDMTPSRIELNLKELSRIENLVLDLGLLTRLESPEMIIKPAPINAHNFLKELQNRFLMKMRQAKLSFSPRISVEHFKGDENLLLRCISNLISNAIRHSISGSEIRLDFYTEKNRICIEVSNTGDIISESEIEKVFDRLFRGEYARKSTGSGLGLTIAKTIAELHGGDISIKSAEDAGTTVKVRI